MSELIFISPSDATPSPLGVTRSGTDIYYWLINSQISHAITGLRDSSGSRYHITGICPYVVCVDFSIQAFLSKRSYTYSDLIAFRAESVSDGSKIFIYNMAGFNELTSCELLCVDEPAGLFRYDTVSSVPSQKLSNICIKASERTVFDVYKNQVD